LTQNTDCVRTPLNSPWRLPLLTESEVERSFRRIIKPGQINQENLDKAELLLDELRPESPLRHRLAQEIEELRDLCKV
jgi:hypothetical protein